MSPTIINRINSRAGGRVSLLIGITHSNLCFGAELLILFMQTETDFIDEVYIGELDQIDGVIDRDFPLEITESERFESNVDFFEMADAPESTELIEPGKQAAIDRMGGDAKDWERTYSGGGYSFDGEQVRDSEGNVWTNEDPVLQKEMLVQWKEGGNSVFFLPDHIRQTEDGEILSITTLILDENRNVSFEIHEMKTTYDKEEEQHLSITEAPLEAGVVFQLEPDEDSLQPSMELSVEGALNALHAENSVVNDTERGEVREVAPTDSIIDTPETVYTSVPEAPQAQVLSMPETIGAAPIRVQPESVSTETTSPHLAEKTVDTQTVSTVQEPLAVRAVEQTTAEKKPFLDVVNSSAARTDTPEIAPQDGGLIADTSLNAALKELFKNDVFESSVRQTANIVGNAPTQPDAVLNEPISNIPIALREPVLTEAQERSQHTSLPIQISVPREMGREEVRDVIQESTAIQETLHLAVLEPETPTTKLDIIRNEKENEQLKEKTLFIPIEAKRDVASSKKEINYAPSVLRKVDNVGPHPVITPHEERRERLAAPEMLLRVLRPDAERTQLMNDARYAKGPEILRTTWQKSSKDLPVAEEKYTSGRIISQLNGITMRRAA